MACCILSTAHYAMSLLILCTLLLLLRPPLCCSLVPYYFILIWALVMDGDAKYMYSSVCISGLATRTADAGVLLYTNYKKKNLNTILQLNYMNTKHRPTVLQQHPRRVLRT